MAEFGKELGIVTESGQSARFEIETVDSYNHQTGGACSSVQSPYFADVAIFDPSAETQDRVR